MSNTAGVATGIPPDIIGVLGLDAGIDLSNYDIIADMHRSACIVPDCRAILLLSLQLSNVLTLGNQLRAGTNGIARRALESGINTPYTADFIVAESVTDFIVNASLTGGSLNFVSQQAIKTILAYACSASCSIPQSAVAEVASVVTRLNLMAAEMLLPQNLATNMDILTIANALEVVIKSIAMDVTTASQSYASNGNDEDLNTAIAHILQASTPTSVRQSIPAAIRNLIATPVPAIPTDPIYFTVDTNGDVCDKTGDILQSTLGSAQWVSESTTSVVEWGMSNADDDAAKQQAPALKAAQAFKESAICSTKPDERASDMDTGLYEGMEAAAKAVGVIGVTAVIGSAVVGAAASSAGITGAPNIASMMPLVASLQFVAFSANLDSKMSPASFKDIGNSMKFVNMKGAFDFSGTPAPLAAPEYTLALGAAQPGSNATFGFYSGNSFTEHDFTSAPEPLIISVDGGPPQTVSITADMVDPATAAAALAATGLVGVTASVDPSTGLLRLTSDTTGTSSAVEVMSGSGEHAMSLFGAVALPTAEQGTPSSPGGYIGVSFTEHDFTSAPEPLIISVDGGPPQTVSITADMADPATAAGALAAAGLVGVTASVDPSTGLLRLTSDATGASSAVEVMSGSGEHAMGLFGAVAMPTAESGTPSSPGAYAAVSFTEHDFRSAPELLIISVDGGPPQTVSITADMADPATAAVALAAAGLVGVTASVDPSTGLLRLTSDAIGTSSAVEVMSGSGEHAPPPQQTAGSRGQEPGLCHELGCAHATDLCARSRPRWQCLAAPACRLRSR
jgi:hypothetical protein